MKKLSSYTKEEIQKMLDERHKFIQDNDKWLYQDNRYKALLKEYGKRILKN